MKADIQIGDILFDEMTLPYSISDCLGSCLAFQ